MVPETGSILAVDDVQTMRVLISTVLSSAGYDVAIAGTGAETLRELSIRPVELVLLDIELPDASGIDLLRAIVDRYPDTAVVMVTGVAQIDTALEVLRRGAYDYLTKPFTPNQLVTTVEAALARRAKTIENRVHQEDLERLVADRTQAMEDALQRLRQGYDQTILALGAALDMRDTETEDHCVRVAGYAVHLARAMGIRDERVLRDLRWGAYLHDIGKIGVPDAILLKPGTLAEQEYEVIKRHPELGYRMLTRIPFLREAAEVVRYHHERFGGTGYPFGLAADAIPRMARVFAVADAVDAMTSNRPYQKTMQWAAVRDELRRCAGSQFDPAVVDAFLAVPEEEWERLKAAPADEHARTAGGLSSLLHDTTVKAPAIAGNASESDGAPEAKRVLFVDDEETSTELGAMSLERLGYSVVGRTDSETALELFVSDPNDFDIVITDHMMPRLLGHDMALRIREIRPDIPIVIATGAHGNYSATKAKEAGFCYLSKPYTLDELGAIVTSCDAP